MMASMRYLLALALSLLVCIGCHRDRPRPAEPTGAETNQSDLRRDASVQLEQQANQLIAAGDFDGAEPIVRALVAGDPTNLDYLKTAAFIQGRRGRPGQAAEILHNAVDVAPRDTDLIQLTVRADMEAGRLFEAIELLRRAVDAQPEDIGLRRMLIGFLGEAQLMDEIPQHLQVIIRARQFDAFLLETIVLPGRRFSLDQLQTLGQRNPDDLRLNIAQVASWMDAARFSEARSALEPIVDGHPDFAPAWGMLARCLAMIDAFDRLERLVDEVPADFQPTADWHFGVARLCRHRQQWGRAIASLWRAVEMRPNDAHTLADLTWHLSHWRGRTSDGDVKLAIDAAVGAIARRQQILASLLHDATGFSHAGHDDPVRATAIARAMFQLGRLWEAEAWSAIAMSLEKTSQQHQTNKADAADDPLDALRSEIVAALSSSPAWQSRQEHLVPPPALLVKAWNDAVSAGSSTAGPSARRVPTDRLALPGRGGSAPAGSTAAMVEPSFVLVDRSKDYGVTYNGHTGPKRFGPMVPLADSLGCGLGLVDFDRDGKTDVYLTSAGGDITGRNSRVGALLRCVGSRFDDVTQAAGAGDEGYGQGVAFGDYNQDGFDDLYLLNFGENQLLRNNGDGTFSNVTGQVGLGGDSAWSSSGAWADINGDGLLDLLVCNYLDDRQQVGEICFDARGNPAPCSPLDFRPAQNQCLSGTASGGFVDVTETWQSDPVPGRSLGIVAGRLDTKHLAILVANDMTANSYLVARSGNGPNDDPSSFQLRDQSFFSGLAVDGRGMTQASMGIAVDDFNDDGHFDLYVTGFDNEYNVFYQQDAAGIWTDRTAPMGLVKLTADRVGFGAKSVDLNNDGVLELFVANGHISQSVDGSRKYAQTIDLFYRRSRGDYARATLDAGSDYLGKPHVGRCVAPLDVNLDGRVDLLITHVTEPPALLINQTSTRFLGSTIELVATQGARDAVGAIATLVFDHDGSVPARRQRRQRFAGNGYLVSAEKTLRFAFPGGASSAATLIDWPDGTRQTLGPIRPGRRYLVVQGQGVFDFGDDLSGP